jgi:hypothetical protein
MATLFKQAQELYDRGFSIIPQRLFLKDKDSKKVTKAPPKGMGWAKYQKQRVAKAHLLTKWKNYFRNQPGYGVAIITGRLSGLVVVDIDDDAALKIVKACLPHNFKTVTVQTGSGGWHLYFRYAEGLKSTAGLGKTGLDIRADGGYVVAPPSMFPEPPGGQYVFAKGRSFDDLEPAIMPEKLRLKLIELINKHEGKSQARQPAQGNDTARRDWFMRDMAGVSEGSRTLAMTRIAGKLKRLRVDKDVAWSIIEGWNERNNPPEKPKELEKQFNSLWKNVIEKEDVEILHKLNEKYSIITAGNNVRIMTEKNERLAFFTKSDFTLLLENQRIAWGNKTVSIADLWLKWENRRQYTDCVFAPGGADNGCYNLWRGFVFVPKAGKWDKYRKHIEDIVAPGYSDWVFQWMARLVQDPGGPRPGTSIVVRGRQGTGKGVFANHFGELFGRHFTVVNDMDHVTGRFTADLANTVLLYIDEATWGGDIRTAGKLKNLITEPRRRIEAKGVDAIYVTNHLNLIISSNNAWTVPSGPLERRFLLLDINESRAGDMDYFAAIVKQLKNGGYAAMMADLMQYKYDLTTLRNIPKTAGTREQILRGLGMVGRFWYQCLYRGTVFESDDFWKMQVVTQRFYRSYEHYCQSKNAARSTELASIFKRELKKLCPSMGESRPRVGNGRTRATTFPSLEQARREFDEFIGYLGDDWPSSVENENITEQMRLDIGLETLSFDNEPPPF